MDSVSKREYRARDLPTRSVTLFPTRAQVVRDIKDIPLESGTNEITIWGLSPSIDEDSVTVEGTGSAIISDIAVELLPNRDIFQEIYPDSDEDDSDSDSDEDSSDSDEDKAEPLVDVHDRINLALDDRKRAEEAVANAESRLKILDNFCSPFHINKGQDGTQANLEQILSNYRRERDAIFQDHMDGVVRKRAVAERINELRKEEKRLLKVDAKEKKATNKSKTKARKAKNKDREKVRRRRAEEKKEKNRIRAERGSFWPRLCWSARITLETHGSTPSSSRRSSITSAVDLAKATPDEKPGPLDTPSLTPFSLSCDLSLSYVTYSAWWSPSYDLALNTTSNTALLCFDARLTNKTSEDWTNCKISLNSSQATFSGLQDSIPTLVPWRLKLAPKGDDPQPSNIITSQEERNAKVKWQAMMSWGDQKTRSHLYGLHNSFFPGTSTVAPGTGGHFPKPGSFADIQTGAYPKGKSIFDNAPPRPTGSSLFGQPVPNVNKSAAFGNPGPSSSGLFGGGVGFGSNSNANANTNVNTNTDTSNVAPASSLFGGGRRPPPPRASAVEPQHIQTEQGIEEEDGPGPSYVEEDDETDTETVISQDHPKVGFQESAFEETGMTTTHDLPGLKTLKTSSAASKQRVARVSFSNVAFTLNVVPKYKPAAYLKAKLQNTSRITLLRGPVGLTIDGSFMGRSTLPRCSAGHHFTIGLGNDPAIHVVYPKPEVKRGTRGVLHNESSAIYTRVVSLTNTHAAATARPARLLVHDQVPVSEEFKLRVAIRQPNGIALNKPGVPTGAAPTKDAKDVLDEKSGGNDWGKATATLKAAGEVSWDVVLNPGRSVKLPLEYEVVWPMPESVMQC